MHDRAHHWFGCGASDDRIRIDIIIIIIIIRLFTLIVYINLEINLPLSAIIALGICVHYHDKHAESQLDCLSGFGRNRGIAAN